MNTCGDGTLDLLASVYARGVTHAVALMRHSAREFDRGKNDLANPLTEEGRMLAYRFGERLPKQLMVRGYASPPERCLETASLLIDGHRDRGGEATRRRPVEGLGVFYVLDQMKMWKRMDFVGGLVPFLNAWFRGEVPMDTMIPAELAAKLVLRVIAGKLRSTIAPEQLDVCVSHDMTLHLVRDRLLGRNVGDHAVDFLDALVVYELDGALWAATHDGEPRIVDLALEAC
ncbi:MAG: histidine phosphatase family protein [Gammaproteobacteria bacterium]|nr:histidine phosphatase family protein [Gammaproteobacteria bacterium]